jgi:P27 family predicted phage terminase small subunit
MQGRKPKPTNLKILDGDKDKDRINYNEPKPSNVAATCPSHLCSEARTEWKRIYPELQSMGLMTSIDRSALAAYCQAYGRWAKYEKIIKEKGELHKTKSGNIITSPALWVANKALEQMYKYMTEFGLTPASRTRLSVAKQEEDPMEQLLDFCRESTNKELRA